MKFLKQIQLEIKNILMSKFLLIIGIIILAFSVISPILSVIAANATPDGGDYYPMPIEARAVAEKAYGSYYYSSGDYDYEEPPITVDGVTIESENPFYWNIKNAMQRRDEMDASWFDVPGSLDLLYEFIDNEISYYVRFAQNIKAYDDYRQDIAWTGQNMLYDKFIYEHAASETDALKKALEYYYYVEEIFDEKYVNISQHERFAAIEDAEQRLERLFRVVENNDFPEYIALQIEQQQKNIKDNEDMIAMLIKQITENPGQEEMLNEQIKYHQQEIAYTKDATIPLLEYRLEKNIVPRDGSWQNSALSDIEMAENNLRWNELKSEEDFNKDAYLKMEYRTYARYKDAMQKKIDGFNETKLIAKNSIDADMPDMKYVSQGARSQTTGFLGFSTFVALFAVVIGGWMIASEFQLGTIRLLMIRPRTRIKILMSKFAAGLLICFALYLAGCLINSVVNGICFGFSDYGFPNFTVSGQVGFLGFYLPKLLGCMIPILFGFCVAFMFSTLVKNIAVSISVPIVCFIGCVILNLVVLGMAYSGTGWEWIVWTPVPYVQISELFAPQSAINLMKTMGYGLQYNIGYGIGLLTGLSAICTFISVWVFKKQDITH